MLARTIIIGMLLATIPVSIIQAQSAKMSRQAIAREVHIMELREQAQKVIKERSMHVAVAR